MTFDIGEDTCTPVSENYDVLFKFTGQIDKVVIKLGTPKLTAVDPRTLVTVEANYHASE
jgi:hypothetical protein